MWRSPRPSPHKSIPISKRSMASRTTMPRLARLTHARRISNKRATSFDESMLFRSQLEHGRPHLYKGE